MDLNLTNSIHTCFNDGQNYQFSSTSIPTAKLRFSLSITIIIYFIYLLPFCFGVFGNISVCLIFFQQRKLRSITNTFLMNLCLNDLIVLCVSIPMTLSAALLEHWVFGSFLCKLVNFTPTLTALVSTFTVAVIAVERWFFIVNKQKFHRNCTILTLILLWFVSIFIALPEFISRELQEFIPATIVPYMLNNYSLLSLKINNVTNIQADYYKIKQPCQMKKIFYCVLEPGLHMRIFSYFVITVQYLVPFLFVSVSCYSISRFLKKRMKRMCAYQTPHYSRKNSQKHQKTKSLNMTYEITEQEEDVPHNNDTSSTTNSTDDRSSHLLPHIRQASQNREKFNERNSLPLTDQQHYLQSQSHTKRRFHRSRKLLICIAALFTISWLPLTIAQLYLEHNEEILYTRDGANFVYGFLLIPCYLISSLSAWFNPVIYNYINRSFRREFYALYSCFFKVSSTTSQKELTETVPKRYRQGTLNIEESNISSARPSITKQGTHAVSFVDEKIKLMHRS
ncbi:unnamed protein product [Rotaria sp. Silwood2]|nr:unnamed protein product [Rotaria sp. Silwood2]CAF2591403.1 unnamed protein product [Rotaria sp. Silwood2]CAF2823585.1 unnamed protein product [Rotaria sp. Silwood2]CAF2975836.1 unnamed protein product [Rotaria sp. Silwood2]CAF3893043.1 unnamed protein product [Rotaria sp. Silwood2]